ncbi:hypothetical protein RSAG8_01103, partial [Rhizoctonia solani AG-8 WAC10335]
MDGPVAPIAAICWRVVPHVYCHSSHFSTPKNSYYACDSRSTVRGYIEVVLSSYATFITYQYRLW